ncbi:MarR family winged helix-turn-helix transcriptional regulator [Arthrobacter globiformis]|uniref:MarR family winged helix-turn-helix transcriptional regulator n=1 Tax=Arthrobacter globiformis TaxID=1665 RepID=UPI0027D850DE|nr:MarR family winged helix-turn-helix transcriptional regulator [Arthrobacter globiformis]
MRSCSPDQKLPAFACGVHEPATLSPLLRRLEAAGLITRRRVPENERALAVELTAAGSALRAEAMSVPKPTMQSLGLNREDVKQLHSAMMRLIDATKASRGQDITD